MKKIEMNRTNLIFIGISVIAFLGLLSSLNDVYSQTDREYNNPLFGFKFQYPSEWGEPSQGSGGVSFIFDKPGDGNFAFDKLSIFIVELPAAENKTLKQYIREYTSHQTGVDYSTMKINETKLSGIPAITATYETSPSISRNPIWEKVQTSFAIKDHTVYQIYYGTGPEIFDRYIANVNKVTNSFEITD
jgi:hypothetical protein